MHKNSMSVSEYVSRNEERRMCPGKIKNGEMFVFWNGSWVSAEFFNSAIPAPIVHSFLNDVTNIDSTHKWML